MDGSFQRNVNKCRLLNKKRGKPFDFPLLESGRRGSNPRPSAWKANALSTELLPQDRMNQPILSFVSFVWAVMDSNHRRRKPAELQSAPFGHSGNCPRYFQLQCKGTIIFETCKRLGRKIYHFKSGYCRFIAFVSVLATCTVFGLLHSVCR